MTKYKRQLLTITRLFIKKLFSKRLVSYWGALAQLMVGSRLRRAHCSVVVLVVRDDGATRIEVCREAAEEVHHVLVTRLGLHQIKCRLLQSGIVRVSKGIHGCRLYRRRLRTIVHPDQRIKLGATPVFDSLSTARSNQGYILKHSQERMLTVRKVMATRSAGMMLSSSVLIYRVKRPQSSLTTLNKQIHWLETH